MNDAFAVAMLDMISHVHLPSFVIMLPKQLQHSTCPPVITQPTDGGIAGTTALDVGSCQYNKSKGRDMPEGFNAFRGMFQHRVANMLEPLTYVTGPRTQR